VVKRGRCGTCATKAQRAAEAERPSSYARGYTRRWSRESKLYLRAHPMCMCDSCNGDGLPAEIVDHVVPHKGNQSLFWDPSNWQAMNKRCHDRKTATQDGGFGRAHTQEQA
jgi:5-methylcytosine-specific restriction protein A